MQIDPTTHTRYDFTAHQEPVDFAASLYEEKVTFSISGLPGPSQQFVIPVESLNSVAEFVSAVAASINYQAPVSPEPVA